MIWGHGPLILSEDLVCYLIGDGLKLRLDDDVGDVGRDGVVPLRTDHGDLVTSPGQLLPDLHYPDLVTPEKRLT